MVLLPMNKGGGLGKHIKEKERWNAGYLEDEERKGLDENGKRIR